jgi:DDE family transposase
LEAVADRGYFSGEEIVACDQAGITVTLPKPMTSGAKSEGRFGKQDFAYLPRTTSIAAGWRTVEILLHQCRERAEAASLLDQRVLDLRAEKVLLGSSATPDHTVGHEHVLEAVQRRLDEDPQAMRRRRETVEHPFGTIKARMGATHFLMKTLPRVAAEMALHVLAYNLTRVINIMG